MKEICEYKLLTDETSEGLSKKVNTYISNGWQPYGTPFRQTINRWEYVSQAVVKYKE